MLDILGPAHRLCDGLPRRTFLRVGALGAAGLGLPDLLQAAPAPARDGFGRSRRCVLLFLTGGPPQHDTFDPKPDAPAGIRGEFRSIPTAVPGVRFGELLPQLARRADRFSTVRSVTHGDGTHTSAGYTMLTGAPHPRPNVADAALIRPGPDDHPHLGCVVARVRPPADGTPAFVALPEVIKDAAVNEFPGQGAGFLGRPFDPFRVEADEARTGFRTPDVALAPDVSADRLDDRQALLGKLDAIGRAADRADLGGVYGKAFDLVRSPAVHRALDLGREAPSARDRYGPHLFGRGCLLARRLLEAGVPLVTVYWHYEGPDDSPVWDTHENNFRHLRERLAPPADRAVSALLDDLADRGMLDDTLLICMGEFGRSPKVNSKAGREHWPHVQSILLAGAGVPAGGVYGSSDRIGGYPATNPVSPADLTATFHHLLGVPPETELHDRTGRPVRACHGTPVRGLVG